MNWSHDKRQICHRKLTSDKRRIRHELSSNKSCMDNEGGSCITLGSDMIYCHWRRDIVLKVHFAKNLRRLKAFSKPCRESKKPFVALVSKILRDFVISDRGLCNVQSFSETFYVKSSSWIENKLKFAYYQILFVLCFDIFGHDASPYISDNHRSWLMDYYMVIMIERHCNYVNGILSTFRS